MVKSPVDLTGKAVTASSRRRQSVTELSTASSSSSSKKPKNMNLVAENIKKVKIEPAAYKNNKYSTYRNSSRVGLLRYTVYLRNLSNLHTQTTYCWFEPNNTMVNYVHDLFQTIAEQIQIRMQSPVHATSRNPATHLTKTNIRSYIKVWFK
ncbi:hypothetical protein YC2023_101819 [Brassica napus]